MLLVNIHRSFIVVKMDLRMSFSNTNSITFDYRMGFQDTNNEPAIRFSHPQDLDEDVLAMHFLRENWIDASNYVHNFFKEGAYNPYSLDTTAYCFGINGRPHDGAEVGIA